MARTAEEIRAEMERVLEAIEDDNAARDKAEMEAEHALAAAKLAANTWAGLATNVAAVTVFAPLAGILFSEKPAGAPWDWITAIVIICLLGAGRIYLLATNALKKGYTV